MEQGTEHASIDDLTFGQTITELEEIVAVLDSSSLELEAQLETFERGVRLSRSLQQRLENAEQRVIVLKGELAAAGNDQDNDTQLNKA